jgi:hypothetical protein
VPATPSITPVINISISDFEGKFSNTLLNTQKPPEITKTTITIKLMILIIIFSYYFNDCEFLMLHNPLLLETHPMR